jgi:hypothetical protein
MSNPIDAITIRQPWAYAIFHGKDIENRTRATKKRGRVAIHAATGMRWEEYQEARDFCARCGLYIPPPTGLVRGYVIGTIEIAECVTESDSPWFTGPYGYVLRNPELFGVPVPTLGMLGFWKWQPPVWMQL